MTTSAHPYEIFNNKVTVQARYLYTSNKIVKAAPQSLCLLSYDQLDYKCKNGVFVKVRNACKGTHALILFDSLPSAWQNLLIKIFGEPEKVVVKGLFEKEFVYNQEARNFYCDSPLKLTDDEIEAYTLNASVLDLVDRIYNKRSSYIASLGNTMSGKEKRQRVANDCTRFKAIKPHTLPEYPDNLFKDLREYKKHKYDYLISGRKGNDNARKVTSAVERFLNSLFAGQHGEKPTYEDVNRSYESFLSGYITVINNETGEEYMPSEFPNIKRSSIQSYLSKWRNEIGNEAKRSGDRQQLMGKFKPYHSLELPKHSGSIISVDDRQPPFEYEKGKRMWFYLGQDIASGAIVTWVYGKDKAGIILEFYRQMVRLHVYYGVRLPYELEAESSLNSSFKDTFLREGTMFSKVRIEANNARGKYIESGFNRKIRYGIEKKATGWIARPFAKSEANQKSGNEIPIIPYNQLVAERLADIEQWNNEPHPDVPEKSRFEYWLENQHPSLSPINWRAIMPHLGYKEELSVNVGFIRLQNQEYVLGLNGKIAFGNELIELLDQVENRDVTVYWIDDLEGKVMKAFVYMGDQYICEALNKPKYQKATLEQKPSDTANRTLMSYYVATVEAFGSSQRKGIEKVTVIDNTPIKTGSFVMPGLRALQDMPSGVIRNLELEAEVLEDVNEDDFVLVEENIAKKSLRDRF
jgi:hypothetical protein